MAEHVYRPQNSHLIPPPKDGPAIGVAPPTTGSIPVSPGQASAPPSPATSTSSTTATATPSPKIHGFGHNKHESIESKWQRPVAKTGGATHVRTFFGSLSQQGLEYLDKHINEWLDQHPDAEVKFATLQVGDMPTATGREPALIAQVWI